MASRCYAHRASSLKHNDVSALILNREIVKKQVWTESQIGDRGLHLAEVAAKLWPRPTAAIQD